MENILNIKNMTFKYEDTIIFNNLNFVIKKGEFITILAANSKGKTTLAKLLAGKLKSNIKYYNKPLKPYKNIRIWDDKIESSTSVINYLSKSCTSKVNLKKLIIEFQLADILDTKASNINYETKYIVKLAKILLTNPEILIIDSTLSKINTPNQVIKVLKEYQKQGLTIINITSNEEEALYTKKTGIINNKIIKFYQTKQIISDENKLKEAGLKLPFIIELSNKLKLYNLINKTYYTKESLVEELWK